MQSKSLLIAIAAFALTTSGVQAHNGHGSKHLSRVGINKDQIEAFQQARELHESGDITGARDRLVEAGVDEMTLSKMRKAKRIGQLAIHEAVEANDYESFKIAAVGSPLIDIITSQEDFDLFVDAHNLKKEGEWEESKEILLELGIEGKNFHGQRFGMMMQHHRMYELSDEQVESLKVARQSNDRETVKAILREAGLDKVPYSVKR